MCALHKVKALKKEQNMSTKRNHPETIALHGGGTHKIMGIEIPEISTGFSLSVIVGTLVVTTVLSLVMSAKRNNSQDPEKSAKEKPE